MREFSVAQAVSVWRKLMPVHPARTGIPFHWATGVVDATMARSGTVAAYLAYYDVILVPSAYDSMFADDIYIPTICHELQHAAQRNRWGFALYEFNKTFRRDMVEAEAVAEERRVQLLLGVSVLA